MRSSTLANLLAALPKEQLESFDRFLASPYFNRNPTLLQLFRLLQPHHPQFKSESLSKEKIYGQLFPGNRFVIASMRNLMTKLTELIRKFMAQEKFEESPELQDRLLLQQYSKFKVEKGFNDLYKKQMKRLEQGSKMDRFQCLENYLTLEEFHNSPIVDIRNLDKSHMKNTVDLLDRFFVLSKLKLQISINSRILLLKESPPYSAIGNITKSYVSKMPENEKPILLLTQNIADIQFNPNKSEVQRLIENYKTLYSQLPKTDRKEFLQILINQLNRIFAERDSKYLKKMHLLYRFGIEKNILLHDQSITSVGFINVVASGAHSGEIAWASRFIDKNLHLLPKSDQYDVKLYTESLINFTRKKYELVNSTLLKVRLRNSKLGFHFRLLMMKNAIERALTNRNDATDGLKMVNTIEKYIKRKGTKNARSLSVFLNFIRVTKQLLKNINEEGKPDGPALKKMIKPDVPIAARTWLLDRIKSLN